MSDNIKQTLIWADENELNLIPIIFKDKKPLIKHKEFQTRLSTQKERKEWFLDNNNNIAVMGGKISDNLLIFDVDNLEFARFLLQRLPKTCVARTKQGFHFYYKTKEETQSIRVEFRFQDQNFGIDIHGKGKYAVIPPSTHPSGLKYKFIQFCKVQLIDLNNILEIINIVAIDNDFENMTQVKEHEKMKQTNTELIIGNDDTSKLIDAIPNIEQMIGFVGNGEHPVHGSETGQNLSVNVPEQEWYCFRHNSGGSKFQWFAIQEGIIECEESSNMTVNQKHKTFETIRERYNIKKESYSKAISFGVSWINSKFNTEDNLKQLKYIKWNFYGVRDKKKPSEWYIQPDKQKSLDMLANLLVKTLKFKCLIEIEVLYIYDETEGIWTERAPQIIRQIGRDVIPKISKNQIIELIDKIITKPGVYSEDIFNKKLIIVLGNGVYDFDTFKFVDFSHTFYATRKIEWDYDPKASSDIVEKALSSWLSPDSVRKAIELIGYCLYPDYAIESFFFLTGNGANGKTSFMNLLKHFLGDKNISAIKPQLFNDDKHAGATLYGKLANIGDDIPSKKLDDGGDIKNLSGNSIYSGRIMYKGFFNFKNTAKLIWSCQSIPSSSDDSDAWYRRPVRLNFANQFLGKDKDPHYLKHLLKSEVMSGLINVSIFGLEALLRRGAFELEFDLEKKKRDYLMGSDSVKAFSIYGVDLNSKYEIKDSLCYEQYKEFCFYFDLTPVLKNKFTSGLKQWLISVTRDRVRVDNEDTGKKIRIFFWKGFDTKINLYNSWEDQNKEEKNDEKVQSGHDGHDGHTFFPIVSYKKEEIKRGKNSRDFETPWSRVQRVQTSKNDVFYSEDKDLSLISDRIFHYLESNDSLTEEQILLLVEAEGFNEKTGLIKYILEFNISNGSIYEPKASTFKLNLDT